MPVKVRCTGCETTLNAPDKARGKSIACPKCGTKIKVPAEEAGSAKSKKKDESEDFLNVLDKIDTEDSQHEICAYCATAMNEDDPVCPKCGMNAETGKMDAKAARRKGQRGPDPSKYFGLVWKDPLEFIKENKGLYFKTAGYWLILWMMIDVSWLIGTVIQDVPLKIFWFGLNFLSRCAFWGWFASLAIMFVRGTLTKDKVKADRIDIDFFQSSYLGVGAIIWPWIVFLPAVMLVMFLGIMVSLDMFDEGLFGTLSAIVFGGAFPIAYLAYPIAVAHQASKYSYKGWIAWELLLLFGRNAAATIYTNIVALVITIIPLGGAIALFFTAPKFAVLDRDAPVGQYMFKLIDWAVSMAGNPETLEFYIKWPIYLFGWMFFNAAFRLIFAFVAAFSALYMVKVFDLFAYYNSSRLGLVPQMPINQPATFWVRYLAFWGDLCLVPLANFLVTRVKAAAILGHVLFAGAFYVNWQFGPDVVKTFYAPVWMIYNWWLYFAVQESSATRTTVVKDAFGLIVSTDKDKTLTLQQATQRFFASLGSALMLGIPFLMCAFRPDKKAFQDITTKTRVVWRGDK